MFYWFFVTVFLPKIGVFVPYSGCLIAKKWRGSAGLRRFLCGFCPALVLNLYIKYKEQLFDYSVFYMLCRCLRVGAVVFLMVNMVNFVGKHKI